MLLGPGQLRLKYIGYLRRDLAFDRENIDQFTIKTIRPSVGISRSID